MMFVDRIQPATSLRIDLAQFSSGAVGYLCCGQAPRVPACLSLCRSWKRPAAPASIGLVKRAEWSGVGLWPDRLGHRIGDGDVLATSGHPLTSMIAQIVDIRRDEKDELELEAGLHPTVA
jgi:hypothetical protein